MIPISPISVKFTDEERAKLKALAATLGWTESQIVRDSVAHTLHLVHHPGSKDEPKLIALARLAISHEENPELIHQHIKKMHPAETKEKR
jgi:predicted transcriptional regulator